jgi:hypothetical protein
MDRDQLGVFCVDCAVAAALAVKPAVAVRLNPILAIERPRRR